MTDQEKNLLQLLMPSSYVYAEDHRDGAHTARAISNNFGSLDNKVFPGFAVQEHDSDDDHDYDDFPHQQSQPEDWQRYLNTPESEADEHKIR